LYEGRLADAVSILEAAIPLDRRDQNSFGEASKSIALAEALAALGQTAAAIAAADRALALSHDEFVAVPAARVFALARQDAKATRLAHALSEIGQPLPRAYANVISGELALRRGRTGDAIASFSDAIKAANVWLARFDRGVAYVEQGGHDVEALSELEICAKRMGEATALFLDDIPTYRYAAQVPYWLGRAQQGVGLTGDARASFDRFLRIKSAAEHDPLVEDARKRTAALAAPSTN
jgi:tetratricopeptide (TPR) repeat protein